MAAALAAAAATAQLMPSADRPSHNKYNNFDLCNLRKHNKFVCMFDDSK